ncbi:disease resistance protein RPS5-like [Prosopis cineraria]|uniref:disease resistance protein RPS5-like n=1 Tax=Prosopis cineraria TaxID=364024 RepID=UPI00240F2085|nr:disease resistance protein RPS5-like [Prosopis cineraria]
MEYVAGATNIIGLIVSCKLHEVIIIKFEHWRTPKRSIDQLDELMRRLDDHRKDVEDKAKWLRLLKGAVKTKECKGWLRQVHQVKAEVRSLKDEPARGYCFIDSRIKLGELIEEKSGYIRQRLEDVLRSEDSIAIPETRRGDILSAIPMMEFKTHDQIFNEIWGFLSDKETRRVGVWGMGGAGKTTIMSAINNRLLTETRSSKLWQPFNKRKKFALILDDVWEPISIETVGIPVPTVENGCKLIIITRNLRVCREMETDKNVEVKVLPKNEVWNLFKNKVGEKVLSIQEIQPIAMDVAKECGGLPLAIAAVGRALRETTNLRKWDNALEGLKTSSTGTYNIDEVVCSRLKSSYSKLNDDIRRYCFLYCGLYPKGHLIDENELINYWVWEDLLEGPSTSVMKCKGQIIIDELISACLLELKIENGVRFVKLHDMIRDMVIRIMSTKPRCIVNADGGQVKPAMPQEWREDVQWVSLMRNNVKSIDFNPTCHRLTSLLLQYNAF